MVRLTLFNIWWITINRFRLLRRPLLYTFWLFWLKSYPFCPVKLYLSRWNIIFLFSWTLLTESILGFKRKNIKYFGLQLSPSHDCYFRKYFRRINMFSLLTRFWTESPFISIFGLLIQLYLIFLQLSLKS